MKLKYFHYLALCTALILTPKIDADELDDLIQAKLLKYRVPGLSIAVIQDGQIVKAQGYGATDTESNRPVTALSQRVQSNGSFSSNRKRKG